MRDAPARCVRSGIEARHAPHPDQGRARARLYCVAATHAAAAIVIGIPAFAMSRDREITRRIRNDRRRPFAHQDECERRGECGRRDRRPRIEVEVGGERDEDRDDDAGRHGVAREQQVQPRDGQHNDEGAKRIGNGRDLTEQDPREPPRCATVEHGDAERKARDNQHHAAPLHLRLGFFPRQHADSRQKQGDACRRARRLRREAASTTRAPAAATATRAECGVRRAAADRAPGDARGPLPP